MAEVSRMDTLKLKPRAAKANRVFDFLPAARSLKKPHLHPFRMSINP